MRFEVEGWGHYLQVVPRIPKATNVYCMLHLNNQFSTVLQIFYCLSCDIVTQRICVVGLYHIVATAVLVRLVPDWSTLLKVAASIAVA